MKVKYSLGQRTFEDEYEQAIVNLLIELICQIKKVDNNLYSIAILLEAK